MSYAGMQNPKTYVSPIIAPPIADFDSWKDSDVTTNTFVNKPKTINYIENSGYVHDEAFILPLSNNNTWSILTPEPVLYDFGTGNPPQNYWSPYGLNFNENSFYVNDSEIQKNIQKIPIEKQSTNLVELVDNNNNISEQYEIEINNNNTDEITNITDEITNNNTDQLNSIPLGNAMRKVIIQNYGPQDVYDPRSYGYGPSERVMVDKNNGEPYYYYDDINEIRRPKFISRTNLPIPIENYTNNGKYMKSMANEYFIAVNGLAREELQNRLLRKYEAARLQQMIAPLSTAYFR